MFKGEEHSPPLCKGAPHVGAAANPPPPPLAQVRRTWGLQRTNRLMAEALVRTLYCRLRWSGDPDDIHRLAAMHMQLGELSQLQLILHSLPLPMTDEKKLQEIRGLFQVG